MAEEKKDAQKDALPLRLQAYERMTLFLERISLTKLLVRISPISNDKMDFTKNEFVFCKSSILLFISTNKSLFDVFSLNETIKFSTFPIQNLFHHNVLCLY